MVNKVVKGFLEFQQSSSDHMFDRFLTLENIICLSNPDVKEERILYRQGVANNEVLLVAYTDNELDDDRKEQKVREQHNTFIGESSDIGRGIDNKAGCAMLWTLRNFGYSLLVLNGSDGFDFLLKNQEVVTEIIAHRYIIELNQNGDLDFESMEQSTEEFKKMITDRFNN